ncbi:hypothetical protein B6N60_05293 [Richelia sinica FACHB-800]|uniref:Uncharacterized protein n=1 Tax=Richelia sinica FACHB-800 TaxID=1357546 RepID=A0A975TD41_9NOST|nr:hypothetical protein B6N60_05293 [Richelia sinica FACHB-800]
MIIIASASDTVHIGTVITSPKPSIRLRINQINKPDSSIHLLHILML